jgi:cytochrome c oxidase cbb3-type subunit 4
MSGLDHATLVGFAKSFGLFYLIVMALGVGVYAYWPANRRRFDEAARTVIEDEDVPWR